MRRDQRNVQRGDESMSSNADTIPLGGRNTGGCQGYGNLNPVNIWGAYCVEVFHSVLNAPRGVLGRGGGLGKKEAAPRNKSDRRRWCVPCKHASIWDSYSSHTRHTCHASATEWPGQHNMAIVEGAETKSRVTGAYHRCHCFHVCTQPCFEADMCI